MAEDPKPIEEALVSVVKEDIDRISEIIRIGKECGYDAAALWAGFRAGWLQANDILNLGSDPASCFQTFLMALQTGSFSQYAKEKSK